MSSYTDCKNNTYAVIQKTAETENKHEDFEREIIEELFKILMRK